MEITNFHSESCVQGNRVVLAYPQLGICGLFVTEATQDCVHGGLQQKEGSLANPLSKINMTTSYENEASLH